ncbi:MAG: GMC oxidoreductase, partial [Dongiaceae bacterium]
YQNSESLMYLAREGRTGAPELVLACVTAPVTTEQFVPLPMGEAHTIMFDFTHPRSRGYARLAGADPRAAPLIGPNYLAEDDDREVYLAALETARAVGAAHALSGWRREEYLPGTAVRTAADKRAFLEKAAFTHHHPVGTCRMGSDSDAVVGPDLKAHGLDGLYVCDGSVMPSITTAPVNAAIIATAERASDLLRGRMPLAPYLPAQGTASASVG